MANGATGTAGRAIRRRADGRDHLHSDAQRPANGPAVRETAVREQGRARSARRTVAVLGTGVLAIGTDMFVVAGILGGIATDLGVTVGSAGLAVTVFALTYATGAVLLAPLLSAQPPRRVLVVSAAAFAVLNVLSALAPTLPALLAARLLSALAASAFVPAAAGAAVAAVPASHRGRALGTVVGCMSAATVLGAPAGVLLASASTWRAAFALPAVLAAATVVGLALTRDEPGRRAEPVARCRDAEPGARCRAAVRERLLPLGSPAVAATLAVTFLLMTASYSTYTYLPLLLSGAAVPLGSGLFIAVFGLAGIAGTWWGGRAADRRGPGSVVGPAVAVSAAAFAALPHTSSTVVAAAVVVAGWGTAVWGFVPAQQHRLIGLCTAAPPLLLALHSGAVHLGSAAGSLLGGLVVDSAGAGRLWTVAVFCCGAAWVVHTALARKENR
ncbi:Predicted arabinose efflux permease, MFS family [Streptomyces wuyuanensis]|uniref:Predicted arabinose efflux permease, MFS family n=1 Tax=Streptomyces wuyuanensis TaxID=1196353 RepID=A0A1G9YT94_9ACTN|nr:Predicted arabinose efflux permease, MFS family [Streptomyces wuyuanensis]